MKELAGAENTKEYFELERLRSAAPALLEALEKAKEFIENGIELGYIKMPDEDTPDSAHKKLPIINAAIEAARGE